MKSSDARHAGDRVERGATPVVESSRHRRRREGLRAVPTGSGITFTIYVGGTAWLTLTIPAGQTAVVATPSQMTALSQIPGNTAVSIGVTAVGSTFPGADLSIFVYS